MAFWHSTLVMSSTQTYKGRMYDALAGAIINMASNRAVRCSVAHLSRFSRLSARRKAARGFNPTRSDRPSSRVIQINGTSLRARSA
jgi:hypothetical protein